MDRRDLGGNTQPQWHAHGIPSRSHDGRQRRRASLQRQSAQAIGRAIDLNKVETKIVDLTGVLVTVSAVAKAELQTDGGTRIKASADSNLAASLGPFYNQRVVVQVEQTTTWSMNTGKETQTFRLTRLPEVTVGPSAQVEVPETRQQPVA